MTSTVGVGSLKLVGAELDENGNIQNFEEYYRSKYALSFVDECLAYGTNAFTLDSEMNTEDLRKYFFYRFNNINIGYNFDYNCEIISELFNKTIQDKSGKTQFRFNYYLTKHVKSLDDLDFTNEEIIQKFESITGIEVNSNV